MLNIPADAPAFLFFGQVRPYKGVENLIEAFSTLQGAQLRLVIAGEPKPQALERSLSAQAKTDSRITTHFGFVPDDQIPVYLNACDLVVLPYLDSLTSGAAVLAMSYGRAVCAPQLGCLKELPPETAILYDSRQPDGLQSALEKALSAPLAEMGRAANAYISQFPWSLTAAPIVSVYQQAVGLKEIPQTPDARLI
jgi:glycosyltransferase involved in cell wall biosynthesis